MKKYIPLLIILLLIWIIVGAWYCCTYWCCPATAGVAAVAPAKTCADSDTWTFNDNRAFKTQSDQFFRFIKSNYRSLSKSNCLEDAMESTAGYLKENTDRSVTVTGLYEQSEVNNSILPDLGLARANNIKTMLTAMGIPASQIITNSKLIGLNNFSNDTLTHGINLSFGALANSSTRINDIKTRLLGNPVTLYFASGQDNINLSAQQRQDFADLIYYLDNVNTSSLDISGHTDNQGNLQSNINLSVQRADFVQNYLANRGGIPTNKMATQGMGPNQPVDTNATPQGRAKNRRVEVLLK